MGTTVVKDKPYGCFAIPDNGRPTSSMGTMNTTKNIISVVPHNNFQALDLALQAAGTAIALAEKVPPRLRSLRWISTSLAEPYAIRQWYIRSRPVLPCPLQRLAHQLSTLIQMNNMEETMYAAHHRPRCGPWTPSQSRSTDAVAGCGPGRGSRTRLADSVCGRGSLSPSTAPANSQPAPDLLYGLPRIRADPGQEKHSQR